jgi:hypothetical protein
MTEVEWTTATDIQPMLDYLRGIGTTSDRKFYLFSVGVCRHAWSFLRDPKSRAAVEILERYAEGQASAGELTAAAIEAEIACSCPSAASHATMPWTHASVALNSVFSHLPDAESRLQESEKAEPVDSISDARNAAYAARYVGCPDVRVQPWDAEHRKSIQAEDALHAKMLRCVVGNPVRSKPPLCSSLLTETVLAIARTIYESRSFDRLSGLAAALEEANCTDAELLEHLRRPGPHARGCWALDAVLDRS